VRQAESKTREADIDDVTQWRLRTLLEAGVVYSSAVKLAITREDLHKMVRDKEAGCPDDLLLRIYLT
jgi:hypothetical protein